MKNLLTDIAGVRVGHADDAKLASGVTAIIFDRPAVAAIDVRGGGPGTRESTLLDPANTVESIDAIALAWVESAPITFRPAEDDVDVPRVKTVIRPGTPPASPTRTGSTSAAGSA